MKTILKVLSITCVLPVTTYAQTPPAQMPSANTPPANMPMGTSGGQMMGSSGGMMPPDMMNQCKDHMDQCQKMMGSSGEPLPAKKKVKKPVSKKEATETPSTDADHAAHHPDQK